MEEYLCCTSFIDCDHQSVIEKAADLTRGQGMVTEKSVSLFYFVRDKIKYNPYLFTTLAENLRATATLQKKEKDSAFRRPFSLQPYAGLWGFRPVSGLLILRTILFRRSWQR